MRRLPNRRLTEFIFGTKPLPRYARRDENGWVRILSVVVSEEKIEVHAIRLKTQPDGFADCGAHANKVCDTLAVPKPELSDGLLDASELFERRRRLAQFQWKPSQKDMTALRNALEAKGN